MLISAFKSRLSFRMNYIISVIFSFLYICLQVFIWKALYAGNQTNELNEVTLAEMISYSLIATATQKLVHSNVMYSMNEMLLDGSISFQLLMPMDFRFHQFCVSVSDNIFWTVYGSVPPIFMAVLVFGLKFDFTLLQATLYLGSVALAIVIGFLWSFIMGMTALWLRNSFFLSNVNSVVFNLFSGAVVPMWFFPGWLEKISGVLPFRYMVYEPISVLMGKTDQYGMVFFMQLFWIAVLYVVGTCLWKAGQKRLLIQGG